MSISFTDACKGLLQVKHCLKFKSENSLKETLREQDGCFFRLWREIFQRAHPLHLIHLNSGDTQKSADQSTHYIVPGLWNQHYIAQFQLLVLHFIRFQAVIERKHLREALCRSSLPWGHIWVWKISVCSETSPQTHRHYQRQQRALQPARQLKTRIIDHHWNKICAN